MDHADVECALAPIAPQLSTTSGGGGLPCTVLNLIMCSCLSDFCVDTGLEQEQYIIVGEGGHMSKISGTGMNGFSRVALMCC